MAPIRAASRSAIRPRFDVTDDNGNMTATLRLENGDTSGATAAARSCVTTRHERATPTTPDGNSNRSGQRLGRLDRRGWRQRRDEVGVRGLRVPAGHPAPLRAGIQPWYLPKGILVDDDAAGVRAYGKSEQRELRGSW